MIEILRTGPFATVQDLGRPGYAALGVSASGAADRSSLRLANRLVGNAESAAALELTYGGFSAEFHILTTIALTGAPCTASLDGRQIGGNGPVAVRPGQRLSVGPPSRALRTYLAVRGGIDVPPVLGSCATDVLSGIGPRVVAVGDRLPVAEPPATLPVVDLAPTRAFPDIPVLDVLLGPRDDWFTAEAIRTLCSAPYQVTAESNRIGARLSGPPLERVEHGELASEPTVRGALQVPSSGQPVLFLADHPVTGGYPVVAVVAEHHLDLAGQLRPGQEVRFRRAQAHRS